MQSTVETNYWTWWADIKDLHWIRWNHCCFIYRMSWQELQSLTFQGQFLRSAELSCLALLLPHQHWHSLFVQMCCQNESICFKSVPFYFKSERFWHVFYKALGDNVCEEKAAEKREYSVSQIWRSCLYNIYKCLGIDGDSCQYIPDHVNIMWL